MRDKAAVVLLIVGSISFLACGFSQSATPGNVFSNTIYPLLEAPTGQTVDPKAVNVYATAFAAYQITSTPTSTQTTPSLLRAKLYLVAIGDNGKSGPKVGCGDSLVAVARDIPRTGAPLKDTLALLFSLKDQYYGQSGLYNALYQSDLKVDGISSHDGVFRVDLSGKIQLGGECDNPRFAGQITQTIMQFSTVKSVQVNLNGKSLDSILSEK